jgi:alpha-methylacyl-CoA racemase
MKRAVSMDNQKGPSLTGPLSGIRVIEAGGVGPVPLAGMLLADQGAEVIRIDRFGGDRGSGLIVSRGKKSICVDLKQAAGQELLLDIIATADVLIEGFRPGVAERLGFGPEASLERNPRLVYGRMTGWGQEGELAHVAGHDITYIALTGALDAIGRAGDAPVPPVNFVGDNGGGAMFLIFGVLSALLEAQRSGRGQVVDAAIIDGVSLLMTYLFDFTARGTWGPRGTNTLDTGAPYYNVYETADHEYLAVGSLEPKFYAIVTQTLGFGAGDLPEQLDSETWPEVKRLLAERVRTAPLEHWVKAFEGTDACVAPVLSLTAAQQHPHHLSRGSYLSIDGVAQPAPAPRLSRSVPPTPRPPSALGAHTDEILQGIGKNDETIRELHARAVVR